MQCLKTSSLSFVCSRCIIASTPWPRLQFVIASTRRRLLVPKRVITAAAHALQLQMAVSVQLRTVIEGGGLKDQPWVPRAVMHTAGGLFVELSRADRQLQKFISAPNPNKSNSPLATNPFFNQILKMRNAACNDAIWDYLRQNDPLLQQDCDKASVIKNNRGSLDVSQSRTLRAFPPEEEGEEEENKWDEDEEGRGTVARRRGGDRRRMRRHGRVMRITSEQDEDEDEEEKGEG